MRQPRRSFIKSAALIAGASMVHPPFNIGRAKPKYLHESIGHGSFKYHVQKGWGKLDPQKTPVNNCHEMVMDQKGRLIMVGDETKNNVLIYDRSGRLLDSWGTGFPGGHGMTLWNAGGEDFLFISDTTGFVVKSTPDGRELMRLEHPSKYGALEKEEKYSPTETTIGPNGDIYIADGYGSNYIFQFTESGEFIRKFGGRGDEDDKFQTAHGICVDNRNGNPTLLITSRAHNSFKRFTLDGKYLETIFLPGAFVCRPVIHGENLYAGVCWSRLKYLNQTPQSGFVTILDKENKVVSNPGGTKPEYHKGELQLMVQKEAIFQHCHDVCIDNDENIYVCQWNADKTYPIKLERV